MKLLRFTLMMLVLLIGIQHSYGATEPVASDNYYCGFKTEDEFNLWTVLMLDNNDEVRTWCYQLNRIPESVTCTSNLGSVSDDWFISPQVVLTHGKSHFIKVKYNSGGKQRIIFTMGKDKTAEAQAEVLLDSVFGIGNGYLSIKLPASASGNYYFGLHYKATAWSGNFTIHSFYLTEEEGVNLTGTVTNNKGNTVTQARVSLKGEKYKEMTIELGESGVFSFNKLNSGVYQLKVTSDGHVDKEETITIGKQNIDHPVVLDALVNFDVKGCVKSKEGTPVKSATVTLKGELSYQTTTDENGNFTIEKAREYKTYKLKIEKDLKVAYTDVIEVSNDEVDLGDIVMETLVSRPLNVKAQEIESGALLSWMLPLKATEIRYDSGIFEGRYSIGTHTEYSVLGNMFDTPILLKGMSWLAKTKSELIDIYVFALDKDGSISNRILYSEKNINNIQDGWNEYYFPEEIVAPYGCVLTLASNSELEVFYDSGNDEGYPATYKNVLSYDYRSGINLLWSNKNFFIRLLGSPLGVPQLAPAMKNSGENMKCFRNERLAIAKAEATGNISYKVWRFEVQNKENKSEWTALELNSYKDPSYLDREYNLLPKGIYQYAVQVVYADGQESAIGYSNEMERKMYTDVTIAVISNLGAAYAEGASATLENVDNKKLAYEIKVSNGQLKFEQIKKGEYNLTVTQKGFDKVAAGPFDFSSDDHYESSDHIVLELTTNNPFNLKVEQESGSMDALFSWNAEEGLFEDFEDMKDFEVNPAGKLGWTYVDGDNQFTAGIAMFEKNPYPNMFAKMAYMSFNPSATNPDLLDYLKPYSGNKILVDVMSEEVQNNDYLFSPELSFKTDFVLSFYAKSGFFADAGNEEFMVGYSTTIATPEQVTWITAEPEQVGAAWVEFTYSIPKEAKFITIRCVSNQKFFFMLDDIYMGYRKTLADQLANYEVYLDGEFAGRTGHSQMKFGNLSKGKHIAKVQAAYTLVGDTKLYSDFIETAFTINAPDGIEENAIEGLYQYDSQNGIVLFGDATGVTAYNTQGQRIAVTSEARMDVSGWQTGLYVFAVKVNGRISHHKIFVK